MLDPFCGSGTILIAAERTGRKARALEIDPTYVDVGVRRWQTYTGKPAVLAVSGETFETIEEQRAARPAAFGLYIYIYAARRGLRDGNPFTMAEFLVASRQAGWAFGAPVIILGGIYGGIFTPTEAAGVACVYAALVTMTVYRSIDVAEFFACAGRAMYLTAQIFAIVAVAGVYSWLLTISGAPQALSDFIGGLAFSPWAILLAINVMLLVVGCFVDTASAILVLTPLLAPIAVKNGVDPVHFGIIMVTNLSIGTFTPPFGVDIFTVQAIFKTPLRELYTGLVPFIAAAVGVLMLITYIPALSLWVLRFL